MAEYYWGVNLVLFADFCLWETVRLESKEIYHVENLSRAHILSFTNMLCKYFGTVQYDSAEQLQSNCPGEEEDDHWITYNLARSVQEIEYSCLVTVCTDVKGNEAERKSCAEQEATPLTYWIKMLV